MIRSARTAFFVFVFLLQSSCADKFAWNKSSGGSTAPPKTLSGLVSTPFPFPAQFKNVTDAAVTGSGAGRIFYVLDDGNKVVRRITGSTVSTLAGSSGLAGADNGTGAAARFENLRSIAMDSAGDFYLADGHGIRKMTPSGVVSTLAGEVQTPGNTDGSATSARFFNVHGLVVDSSYNVYVCDRDNHLIRQVNSLGTVTTLAGSGLPGDDDGSDVSASFNQPSGIVRDSAGNLFVADTGNHTIRKIDTTGDVTLFAGQSGNPGFMDGDAVTALFDTPTDLAIDASGNLYVTDAGNHAVRRITPAGDVTTLAGGDPANAGHLQDGTGADAGFDEIRGLTIDSAGDLHVADSQTLRAVTPAGVVTTTAGQPDSDGDNDGPAQGVSAVGGVAITRNTDGNFYFVSNSSAVFRVTPAGVKSVFAGSPFETGSVDGIGAAARFESLSGIVHDAAGNLYVSDLLDSAIRKIAPDGVVTTYAGSPGNPGSTDGNGTSARFETPVGLAIDSSGNIYVSDLTGCTVRRIDIFAEVATLAGTAGSCGSTDGPGATARFAGPVGLAVGPGGALFVADRADHTIRRIAPNGVVSTVAGSSGQSGSADGEGSDARFLNPFGIAADGNGNLYVSDSGHTIRKLTATGQVTTLAGSAGQDGLLDGDGASARFDTPKGLFYDPSTPSLYVMEDGNARIRKVD